MAALPRFGYTRQGMHGFSELVRGAPSSPTAEAGPLNQRSLTAAPHPALALVLVALSDIGACAVAAPDASSEPVMETAGAGLVGAGAEAAAVGSRARSSGSGVGGVGFVGTAGAGADAARGGAGAAAQSGAGAVAGREEAGSPAAVSGQGAVAGRGEAGAQAAASGEGAAVGGAGAGGVSAGAGGAAAGPAADGEITIWLAGDSTVAKGNTPCPVGWGASFQALFEPAAKVVNSAVGGRSVRTWLYEVQTQMDSTGECALNKDSAGEPVLQMRWQAMLDGMKPGDYLFIQFGINDSSRTCDRHVGLAAFKESYAMMAEAAITRGAQPIFVTPVSAIACQGMTATATRGEFVTATLEAGETYDVPVIDLHKRSIELYNELGLCPIPGGSDVSASTGGKVGAFFCEDHTHFDAEGASQIAALVAEALRDQSLGLASYLK